MTRQRIPTNRGELPSANRSQIGAGGLVVFYVTNLVGAGILIVPGLAAQIAGPASLLSWAALVLLSFPIARLFADIAARRPECGGISVTVKLGLGPTAGDTSSALLVAAFVLFNPVMGIASARYACDLLGLPAPWTLPLAAVCMLLSVAFCFARLGTTAKVQGVALAVLIAGLAIAVALATPSMSAAHLAPFAPHGWLAVGTAMPVVFLSFIGWESVSAIAGEVRDSKRAFPRAIAISVPIVAIIYLGVVIAFLAMPHAAGALVVPTLLGRGAGRHAHAVGDVFALILIGLCTNTNVLCGSRLVVAAAHRGLLPAQLATRSEKTGAPVPALLALAGAYVLMIAIIAAARLRQTDVVAVTTAIFMLVYLATAVAVLRQRPTRASFIAALLTGIGALCMLPFTGPGLPVAGFLTIPLVLVLARRHGATRLPSNSQPAAS